VVVGIVERPKVNFLRVLPFERDAIPALIRAGIPQVEGGAAEPSPELYQVGGIWYGLGEEHELGVKRAYLARYDRVLEKVCIPGLVYTVDPKTGEKTILEEDFDVLAKSFPVIREENEPKDVHTALPLVLDDPLIEPKQLFLGREVVDLSTLGFERWQWPARRITATVGPNLEEFELLERKALRNPCHWEEATAHYGDETWRTGQSHWIAPSISYQYRVRHRGTGKEAVIRLNKPVREFENRTLPE
jgi:hypothetical protein